VSSDFTTVVFFSHRVRERGGHAFFDPFSKNFFFFKECQSLDVKILVNISQAD